MSEKESVSLLETVKNLQRQVECLTKKVQELEHERSYVGKKIKNFYCNGYFGRDYDLEDAEVVFDGGLRIEVRTTEGRYRSADFDDYDEKFRCLAKWLSESEDV